MRSAYTPRHRATTDRRLPRVASGAVVAAVVVVLLVGTNGSLALWRATSTVKGGTVGSGGLGLTGSCSAWTFTQTGGPGAYVGSTYPGSSPATGTSSGLIEPNDTLRSTCTYTLRAVGEHLRGTLAVTQPGGAPAGTTATATFTVGGVTQSTFTDADNGKTVSAVVTLTIPNAVSTLQGTSFTLTGATVTATQVHA